MSKVRLNNVWKIFGASPQHVLSTLDASATRAEILNETGHVVAVRDVSFEISEGEIFVVMGLSGSGKSTLIRCLSRLIEPTNGRILINNQDVTKMGAQQLRELRRKTVSMVFQRFGLFPHRTVLDNVAYGLEVQGMTPEQRHDRASEILQLVGLSDWQAHYPHELSGGMQQRVGLARALAVDPEILLCDEPFSALDPLIRRDMQNELLHLQQQLKKTIVFITHDFLEALKIGDRIAIMKDGEIVQIGSPQRIVSHPATAYVREFVRDVPLSRVLTARAVMSPLTEHCSNQVTANTTLEELIPIVAPLAEPVRVVDSSGEPIGQIDRVAVMLALGGDR